MVITDTDTLLARYANSSLRTPLLALLSAQDMMFIIDVDVIELPTMTEIALSLLPRPFFLMVESSKIGFLL